MTTIFMVEENREQIGTLKGMGYRDSTIASKYIFYALTATLIGSVIGFLAGQKILPYFIINAYRILYNNLPVILMPNHEVMQQAYAQANETINKSNQQAQGILDSATQDANNIRLSAITYTDDMLANLGNIMGMWKDIDVEYLARFGIECPKNLQRDLEGLSFRETAVYFKKRFSIPDTPEKIGQDWLDMSNEKYLHSIGLKPGVPEFLRYLKKKGIAAAIASSNHYGLIADCLNAHGILDCFRAVITCDDVSAGKPDPSVYLEAAKRLTVPPSACLVFEDIPIGIEAGKNAGMPYREVKVFWERMTKGGRKSFLYAELNPKYFLQNGNGSTIPILDGIQTDLSERE